MKSMFGFAVFLLFLAGIALVMLQGRQMSIGGGGAELTGVHWRAVSVGDREIAEDSGVFIQFEVDGSVKGNSGCNNFFGSLEKSDSGIGMGQLGSTRKACPGPAMSLEATFLEAITQTDDIKSGRGTMRLLDSDGDVLAEFVDGAGE